MRNGAKNFSAGSTGQLLTPIEAAAALGLKPQTLATWRIKGRYNLPYYRAGRRIRYKPQDLADWLNSRGA
jgi:excisionase family DNA binding protein